MKLTDSLPKYGVALYISHNDHKCAYKSAEEHLNEHGFRAEEWINREDFNRAKTDNSIWEIQCYPDTPIGSYTVYGSTLETATEAAKL